MLVELCGLLEERDATPGHGARVTALAEAVAGRLCWSGERLAVLRLGGLLHDVGKVAVDGDVLRKPGPLTPDEVAGIRVHPGAGAELVGPIRGLRAALPCVLYHHERWDGGGYPSGRAGSEIPVEARLLAIADAFDAMTSARPYRRALTRAAALSEVARCAGTQFDPQLAAACLDTWADGLAA